MDQAAPSLTPLGLDPNGLLYFGIALVVASVIVGLQCWRKFDEPTEPRDDDDLITQFLPHDLASPKEYSYGLLTYIISMIAVSAALSVLGPPVLKLFALQTPIALGATPVVVALAIGGLLPNVPVLKDIEINIRRFAHARAFIPGAARATADRLTTAGFDFSQYRDPEVSGSEEMHGVEPADFEAQRGSIEYNWARLCCLCYALRVREDEETETLDRRLLKSYRSDLNSVYDRRATLEVQIARLRANSADAGLRPDLRLKIRDALQKLYVFIGCSARLRDSNRSQIDAALADFGFELEPVAGEAPDGHGDVMIVGLAVMGASVWLICYIASELGKLHLWNTSPYFPSKPFDPFVWAFSTILAQGAAILTADRIRRIMIKNGKWYDRDGEAPKRRAANYIKVGAACAVVGYIVLLAWGIALQPATWAMAQGALAYAFMPAMTGAFYAVHLDNVELNSRPARLFEIAPQAILTSFAGAAASDVWISLGDTIWPAGMDFVILVAMIGFAVGASLAWYIPRTAVRRNYDPLRAARENRVRQIMALATPRFSTPEDADRWLRTATPKLRNQSPITALSEARNYEEVLRLVNGIRLPAADGAEQRAVVHEPV